MTALLDNTPGLHHANQVGPANGAQPVGNDDSRAANEQPLQRLLDQRLGHRVHAGGRFIQDQDARVGQDGPGNADQLALANGEIDPAFENRASDSPLATWQ